jgi:hypothetical protein
VAHACDPSYSGGRDQDNHSSKPAWATSLQDPISTNAQHTHKRAGVVQGVGLESKKPQYFKKKKKEKGKESNKIY